MGQATGNKVLVELDSDNDWIKTKSGMKFFIDTSFEPEKHVVRVGTVKSVPTQLWFNEKISGLMPWKTDIELKVGDKVVMYYLAVLNCIENGSFIREDKTTEIFIDYNNIYAIIEEGNVRPINGYVLVEKLEDPNWLDYVAKMESMNMEAVDTRELSKKNVTFGKVAYIGAPNVCYFDKYKSDENIDIKQGDVVVLKKVRDIPMEFEYHARIDGGRKLFRLQRHDILAVK